MPNDNSNMVNQIRDLTAKVLFSLSVNNFSAVFSRISSRLHELSVSSEENPDHTDVELIQYIDVDMARLTKILSESISKFKSLKKSAYLALMNALEKAIWNWMHNYCKFRKFDFAIFLVCFFLGSVNFRISSFFCGFSI